MKKLLVLHTGGTISMSENKDGYVTTNNENPVSNAATVQQLAEITEIHPFQVPSPHMTLHHMNDLRKTIILHINEDNYDGVVITHGTDTLEETAYFLDLTLNVSIPVILTGAMRSSNEIGADGLYNYIAAVRTACDVNAKGKGVLVVFNDEIHSAKNVTKTHTSNTSTFQSPNYGPLGIITKNNIYFHHLPVRHQPLVKVDESIKVGLIKAHADLDAELLRFFSEAHYNGVIIEALGQGNLPPSALSGLNELLAQHIPVVLVSRCFNGIVSNNYQYEGGGYELHQKGVIFSNGLNGQKARLKLIVALSNGLHSEKLTTYFSR
ncbi:asparaginase [Macrococcus equipercicus]|uniref:asparaginase n=1 Tax=Macrococcus equipercicus TaxID=69967 RepID=A0A9Q9BRP9_9STAP|nr:asparaginase [Macrococcus equipercicus]KAA1040175.1 asparaginase [Macrococcus equipercicus]UTH12879.1 asparaginase [Macrococcus equipercicus]